MRNVLPAGLMSMLLLGCMTPMPPVDGPALSPGIYAGTLTIEVRILVNNAEVDAQDSTLAVTETIDAAGLPELASGRAIRIGDVVRVVDSGASFVDGAVTAITESDNRLVVNLTLTGEVDGVPVAGTGSTTYTAISQTAIDRTLTLDFTGQAASGDVLRQIHSQSGRLTR